MSEHKQSFGKEFWTAMKTMKSKHYIMSEVSPKDYDKFEANVKSYLQSNYAEQFGRRLQKNADYKRAFEAIYGRDWHKQTYKKLLRIAKMLPSEREFRAGYKMAFNRADKKALFYFNELEQSIFAKKVRNVYGKGGLTWLMNNRKYLGAGRAYTDTVVDDCKKVVKLHKYMATNLKDIKSDYMKQAKKDFNTVWQLSNRYSEFRNMTKDTILTGELREQVLGEYIRASFRQNTRGTTIDAVVTRICSDIITEANNTRYYDATTGWGQRKRKAMMKGIFNLQQMDEFKELLKKLDMEALEGSFCGKRLNRKLLTALKSIDKAKVSNECKQETVWDISRQLQLENNNSNVYSPCVRAIKRSEEN